jgi:hypothetical protein
MNNAEFAARVWAQLERAPSMPRGHRLIVCRGCGETRVHNARGLCNSCYHRLHERPPGGVCAECGRTMKKLRRGVCDTCGQHVPGLEDPGWTVEDVADALGVTDATVETWIARSWLRATFHPTVIADQALHAFLWRYPAAWCWAEVDPDHRAWVRGLLHDNDLILAENKATRAARKAALALQASQAA